MDDDKLNPQFLALTDWDGTIRRGFTIQAWMRHLQSVGLLDKRALLDLESAFAAYSKGRLQHDNLALSSAKIYASSIAGISVETVESEAKVFIKYDSAELMHLSLQVIEELRKRRIKIFVISGAPDVILREYQRRLDFTCVMGLRLDHSAGRYTGHITENPGLATTKKQLVQQITLEASNRIVLAMGNSDSDIPLFGAASLSVLIGEFVPDNPGQFLKLSNRQSVLRIKRHLDKE